jgi:hypothetical protein
MFWMAHTGGRRLSATFHGLAVNLILLPLLFEATARFKILAPETGALALLLTSALLLSMAWKGRYPFLTWVSALMLPTAVFACGIALVRPILFSGTAIAICALIAASGAHRKWFGLGGYAAAFALACLTLLTLTFTLAPSSDSAKAMSLASLLITLALPTGAIFAAYALPPLRSGRPLPTADLLKVAASNVVGFSTWIWVLSSRDHHLAWSYVPALGAGALCYAIAYLHVPDEATWNSRVFSVMGGALTATGFLLWPEARPFAFQLLAAAALMAWIRLKRPGLSLHAFAFACIASFVSGFASDLWGAFWGSVPPLKDWLRLPPLVFTACIAGTYPWVPFPAKGRREYWNATRILWGLLLVLMAGLYAVVCITPFLEVGSDGLPAGPVATLRTVILSLAATALSRFGRWDRVAELRFLAYPILALTGFKILFSDLGAGSALNTFVSLAVYGTSIILVSRLRRG